MPRRRQDFSNLLRHRIVYLGVLVMLLGVVLTSISPLEGRAWMQQSPVATPTPKPPSPTSPISTTAPTIAAPTPTTVASATPTTTPITIPPTTTPVPYPSPALPSPTPDQIAPIPEVSPGPTETPTAQTPSSTMTKTVPAGNPDNLIRLIDTMVLYSAYFLLGLGLIIFVVVLVLFYQLYQRAKHLPGDDNTSN